MCNSKQEMRCWLIFIASALEKLDPCRSQITCWRRNNVSPAAPPLHGSDERCVPYYSGSAGLCGGRERRRQRLLLQVLVLSRRRNAIRHVFDADFISTSGHVRGSLIIGFHRRGILAGHGARTCGHPVPRGKQHHTTVLCRRVSFAIQTLLSDILLWT